MIRFDNLTDKEKSFYKKLLSKISHESNAYLKLGADRYIGFKMLILKKTNLALSFPRKWESDQITNIRFLAFVRE